MAPESWLTIYKALLYLGTLLVAISTIGMSVYAARIDASKDSKIDELLAGTKQLQVGNTELLTKVAEYQADLSAKQSQIEVLKTEAARAGRGEYSTWDFNGTRREGRAGAFSASIGDEVTVFQTLAKLEEERNHEEIVRVATAQIARTPDWLTPYFLRGLAFANLGQLDQAIADLEYVVEKSRGDASYAGASSALERIRSSTAQ